LCIEETSFKLGESRNERRGYEGALKNRGRVTHSG